MDQQAGGCRSALPWSTGREQGMRRFEQQVALITGGAAGIGFATARRIAAEGGRVVLLDWSEPELRNAVSTLEA
ncbi:MAG: SDR family NAD(P)-dependent oxidoreductase, partial [Actinomycetota bacterium]